MQNKCFGLQHMDLIELERLDLHPKILDAAKRVKLVTFRQILALPPQELMKETGLSDSYVQILQTAAAKAMVSSGFVTCLQLKQGECSPIHQRSRLSFGCPVLNSTLGGGLLTGTITEITGESSAGKTQLCLQLAIQAQLSADYGGLGSKVAYICTEERFPFKRLNSITAILKNKHSQFQDISFGSNIFVNHIKTLPQMLNCFQTEIPNLLQHNIKLIVIDSVAGLFRSNYDTNEYHKRAQDLQKFGIEMWRLANEHGIAVVCVNQVSSNISKKKQGYCTLEANLVPVLGLVWANLLTTRLALSRTNRVSPNPLRSYPLVVRTLKVIFSSYLARTSCSFVVTENGASGLRQSISKV